MASWSKFQDMRERLGKAEIDFNSDAFKVALSNTAPNLATQSLLADITEITAGNGYVAGGVTLANKSWVETGGIGVLDADDVVIVASGGAIAPFRYVNLYDDTATGKPLIQVGDLGEVISLSDGEQYTLQWGAQGLLRLD